MTEVETRLSRLRALESSAIGDVMAVMGLKAQVLHPSIRPVAGATMAGIAVTAEGSESHDGKPIPTFQLDDLVTPHCVVVISTNRCVGGAIIGGNMASSMQKGGAAGIIVDGGIRDADELSRKSIPVWHEYTSPVSAHGRWKYVSMNQPVKLPGIWEDVRVCPGDYIIGDADGVCIVPAAIIDQVITDAEIHSRMEAEIGAAIDAGEKREHATKARPRLAHVKPTA